MLVAVDDCASMDMNKSDATLTQASPPIRDSFPLAEADGPSSPTKQDPAVKT